LTATKVCRPTGWQSVSVFVGRFLLALIFIMSGPNHFSGPDIEFTVAQGVPLASITVPLSGIVALAGGLSILLGYRARLGAWLIALFLVPVTVMMHNFRTVTDPACLPQGWEMSKLECSKKTRVPSPSG
jgi:putative oxidoreductase